MAKISIIALFVLSFLIATASSSDSESNQSDDDDDDEDSTGGSHSTQSGGSVSSVPSSNHRERADSQGPGFGVIGSEGDVSRYFRQPPEAARAWSVELDHQRRPVQGRWQDGAISSWQQRGRAGDNSDDESVNGPDHGIEFQQLNPNRRPPNGSASLPLFPGGYNDNSQAFDLNQPPPDESTDQPLYPGGHNGDEAGPSNQNQNDNQGDLAPSSSRPNRRRR